MCVIMCNNINISNINVIILMKIVNNEMKM